LDYIERDLAGCGMLGAMGTRFLDFFTITHGTSLRPVDRQRMALRPDKRGMPRPDVESEVVKLLSYRYELAERVYFHHAKTAASVMIGRAVVEAGLVPDVVIRVDKMSGRVRSRPTQTDPVSGLSDGPQWSAPRGHTSLSASTRPTVPLPRRSEPIWRYLLVSVTKIAAVPQQG
jgi:hypothetical protein